MHRSKIHDPEPLPGTRTSPGSSSWALYVGALTRHRVPVYDPSLGPTKGQRCPRKRIKKPPLFSQLSDIYRKVSQETSSLVGHILHPKVPVRTVVLRGYKRLDSNASPTGRRGRRQSTGPDATTSDLVVTLPDGKEREFSVEDFAQEERDEEHTRDEPRVQV